jgi:RNA polymerase sigma factor (sigma-70 family)
MISDYPTELAFLGNGTDPASREEGWSRFVARFTRLLMKTAYEFGGGYDERMDRYHYVLESLRQDDFRRLRAFRSIAGSSVPAWLAVVARRLCLDHERRKSGRPRARDVPDAVHSERRLRRALAQDGSAQFDPGDRLPSQSLSPEEAVREQDLRRALERAIQRLEPRLQLALRLRYEDDLSVAEIGRVLGMRNVFQVYRLLRLALDEARRHLRQSGVEDASP